MIVVVIHNPTPLYPWVFLSITGDIVEDGYLLNKKHPYAAMYHTGELSPHAKMPMIIR